ncbi:MAG: MltA domain-containing protein, partial [Rickettsiales bacterium]|nr:MltA domain-containing protein [Rickettsiales bacterium]
KAKLKKVQYSDLPAWKSDSATNALFSFSRSCELVQKNKYVNPSDIYINTNELKSICNKLPNNIAKTSNEDSRKFFEKYFNPYLVMDEKGSSKGLFTGYYQPYLHGSKTKTAKFDTPIYGKPKDLGSGKYHTRKEIEAGILAGKAPVLYWTEHHELFHLQVQGSGILILPDGKKVALGYAGNNGHIFKGAGTILMGKGIKPDGGYAAGAVKDWCGQNKELSKKYLSENDRYIFFQENSSLDPIGSQGVPLTAQRSLAVDMSYIPIGLPLFLTTNVSNSKFNKLVIAQDTGVKITGAIRGDIYFGTGEQALKHAGTLKSQGSYYILLPKGTKY